MIRTRSLLRTTFFEDQGEQRFAVIGWTRKLVLLLVVFVERSTIGEEVIHLISARKAGKYEITIYNAASQA